MLATLSKSAIAAEALALIDEAGLDAFSTRRLGARLGVEAMSLYHHFPSKQALLDAVALLLADEIVLPPEDRGWRSWMGQACRSRRAVALAHPKAAPLLAAQKPTALFEAQCRVLAAANLAAPDAARSALIVNAFVTGAIQDERTDPATGAAIFERGLVMIFDGIAKTIQRTQA